MLKTHNNSRNSRFFTEVRYLCISAVILLLLLSVVSCAGARADAVSAEPDAPIDVQAAEEPLQRIGGFKVISSGHRPGGIFEAVAPVDPAASSARVSLVSPGGDVLRRVGAVVLSPEGFEPLYYFLLGFDSWLAGGIYSIRLTYLDEDEELLSQREYDLSIDDASFRRSVIALNSRLTNIRTDDSAERQRQSEVLNKLLTNVDVEGVFLPSNNQPQLPLEYIFHTAEFGDRRVYEYSDGSSASSVHNGLDYRAAVGVPVFAPIGGRVVMAEDRIVTGNSIVIEHLPGVYSLYYHLETLDVETGDMVVPGDNLGTAGMTGLATGSHLHWEIRINTSAVDPDQFIEAKVLDSARLLQVLLPTY